MNAATILINGQGAYVEGSGGVGRYAEELKRRFSRSPALLDGARVRLINFEKAVPAFDTSIDRMRACACGLCKTRPCSIPGR